MIKHIKKETLVTSEWSGGTTTQLYIYPESGDYKTLNFDFRLSTATVDLETSNFTKLPGINRLIMSLDNALSLTHNDGQMIDLRPFEVDRFKGDDETISFGRVTDFNVMFNDCYDAEMKRIESEVIKTDMTCLYAYEEATDIMIKDEAYHLEVGELLVIMDKIDVSVKEPVIWVQLNKK